MKTNSTHSTAVIAVIALLLLAPVASQAANWWPFSRNKTATPFVPPKVTVLRKPAPIPPATPGPIGITPTVLHARGLDGLGSNPVSPWFVQYKTSANRRQIIYRIMNDTREKGIAEERVVADLDVLFPADKKLRFKPVAREDCLSFKGYYHLSREAGAGASGSYDVTTKNGVVSRWFIATHHPERNDRLNFIRAEIPAQQFEAE